MLNKLPTELLEHICDFLPAKDVLAVKTVEPMTVPVYDINIARCSRATMRVYIEHFMPEPEILENYYSPNLYIVYLEYYKKKKYYPMIQTDHRLSALAMFATDNQIEILYLQNRYIDLARIYVVAPNVIFKWCYYEPSKDAVDILLNINQHINVVKEIKKYHDWVWTQSEHPDALEIIATINSTNLFNFVADDYKQFATSAKFIEYLTAYGASFDIAKVPKLDYEKIKILYYAELSKKYDNVVGLFIVLICLVLVNLVYSVSKSELSRAVEPSPPDIVQSRQVSY